MDQLKETAHLAEQAYNALEVMCRLNSDFDTQVQNLANTSLGGAGGFNPQARQIVQMPKILHLLYPNFTFNFIDLPKDFLALTKAYYDRQCRNCH